MLTSQELEGVLKMSFKQAEKKYRFNKKEFFNAKYEYWNRKNGALVVLVFCFVGFGLGVTGNRGKKKSSAVTGLLCLILYYGVFFSLVSLAKSEKIPIQLAVFTPAVLLAGVGAWFYTKLDWQS
jgi:lipopolysaccharide export LptBFGC system permease protein LptF